MKAHRITGLAVFLTCLTSAASAAEPLAINAGTRVRVTTAGEDGGNRLTGTVLSSTATELLISNRGQGITVPRDHISKLEIRTGGVSHGVGFLRGIGIGILAGGTIGALLGASSNPDESDFFFTTRTEAAVAGAVVLGTLGIPIGGLLGLATSGIQYAEVPAHTSDLALSLAPTHDRDLLLAASLRF